MEVEGKTILQTTERTELTGKEGIPFQEGTQNGHMLLEKIKEYISSDVYICPGVFQTAKGWSTTDVESIVGNWNEFIDACKHKAISIRMYGATTNGNPIISDCYVVPYMGSEFYPERPVMLFVRVNNISYSYNISSDKIQFAGISYESLIKDNVIDDLYSNITYYPLSANQGRILNEKIEWLNTIIENTTESTKELQANTYYVFGEVETLTLTLAAEENWMISEYMFEFTSGTTPTVITPIDGVEWRGDTIEANKVYQASIVRGIGILVGRDIA